MDVPFVKAPRCCPLFDAPLLDAPLLDAPLFDAPLLDNPATEGERENTRLGAPDIRESDPHYFRLDCSPRLLCDLYFDVAVDRWILDRVFD